MSLTSSYRGEKLEAKTTGRLVSGVRNTGHEIEYEHIPVRTPSRNPHIEVFHALLEHECLSRYEFQTFVEAYVAAVKFMNYYNNRWIHGGLGYRTPIEHYQAIMRNEVKMAPISLKVSKER